VVLSAFVVTSARTTYSNPFDRAYALGNGDNSRVAISYTVLSVVLEIFNNLGLIHLISIIKLLIPFLIGITR